MPVVYRLQHNELYVDSNQQTATNTRWCRLWQCELIDKLHFIENLWLQHLRTVLKFTSTTVFILLSACYNLYVFSFMPFLFCRICFLWLSHISECITVYTTMHHSHGFLFWFIMPHQYCACCYDTNKSAQNGWSSTSIVQWPGSSSVVSSDLICSLKACCTKVLSNIIK